jgi:hypothetical protein
MKTPVRLESHRAQKETFFFLSPSFGFEDFLRIISKTFRSSEIFPYYYLYDIERRDRPKDPHGGVLIAAKKQLQLGNITKSKDIELITGSVSLEGKKKMLVGAFYRPPDKTNEDYLNKVKEEISTIKEKHRRDIFVIGGDFNLPDINWEEQTIINRQYLPLSCKYLLFSIDIFCVSLVLA